jgi:hypothetical protein
MVALIKWNGKPFYQLTDKHGDIIMIDPIDLLRDMDCTVNEFWTAAPHHLNTTDPQHLCKWCNTSYRDSDQRDHDRCPFCWRLI